MSFAERLIEARKKAGLTQWELAVALGDRYSQSMISNAERGRSSLLLEGAKKAAEVLNVSLDYLTCLSDDPLSERDRLSQTVPTDYVVIHSEAALADMGISNGTVYAPDAGMIPFRRGWMDREGIDDDNAAVFRVSGDSMSPTLEHGDAILVDYGRSVLRENGLFLLQDRHRMMVKRARQSSQWWFISDNPKHASFPLEDHMIVMGEVKWCGRAF